MKHVGDYAEELGLKSYDIAMPQAWFDDAMLVAKMYDSDVSSLQGDIVWCYDGNMFGYPVGLTHIGRLVVGTMAERNIHARVR